jgi:hypothetical protein
MTIALYRRLLGDQFEKLPARVRELHDVTTTSVWAGRADVERGSSWFARVITTLFGLPPHGGSQPLKVTFQPVDGGEVWTREFGARVFRSIQSASAELLCEQVGPVQLLFALVPSEAGLGLRMQAVRFFGIPLPAWLHPFVRSMDREEDARYRFEVEAHLPVFGLLVRYTGWLEQSGALRP